MAQGDLFTNLMEGSGVWNEALRNNVISMERLKEIQEEIAEQQMDIYSTKRDMLKSDYKGANVMKRMVSSGAKIMSQTDKIKKAKKDIASTENDLIRIQKKIHEAQKLGKDSEAKSLKKQYNAIQIKNQKNLIGLKQMRQTIPVLGKLSAKGGLVGGMADTLIDGIGGIAGAIPVIGSIVSGLITVGKTIVNLVLAPLKAAFKVFLEMQSAVGNLSADIGLTAIESRLLMNNMAGLALSAMKFGGNMKDVVTVMQQFSEITGKNRMFTEGQIGKLVELGLGTGLGVEAASEMAASFDNMGISLEKTINLTDKARGLAARYNVNTTKVLKTYDGLVKSLTGIGFGKGLENLTKLAAKATAIRFDIVGSTKAFADAFFDPEKAVEAAARMQTLGGKFAASFGDPMQLAFESMNDPTALAEKFAGTVSEIVRKDSKGNYFIPPEERKSLQIASETLGQNYEEAVQTAIEQRKIADKMATLQKSGFNLMNIKEEDRPALANLMNLNEKGQYTIKNSAGVDVLLENMTDKNQLKAILDSRKKNEDAAIGRKNMMERLEMIYDRFIMGFSGIFTKLFGGSDFDSFLTMVEAAGTSLAKFIHEDIMGSSGLSETFKSVMDSAKSIFTKITDIWGADDNTPFLTKIGTTLKTLFSEVAVPIITKVIEFITPILKAGIGKLLEIVGDSLPLGLGDKMKNAGINMQKEAIANTGAGGSVVKGMYGQNAQSELTSNMAGDSTLSNLGTKTALKAGEGIVKKGIGKAGAKIGAKFGMEAGGKLAGKMIAKRIPGIGLIIGAMDAISQVAEGDYGQAAIALTSGLASTVPGWGTAISIGLDAVNAGIDINDASKQNAVNTGGYNDGQFSINSSGKEYVGKFAKGDMVQFIQEKAYQDAMSSMGGGSGGSGSVNSTVVRHEGTVTLQTPDGRFITHDQFNGASDMFGARLAGIDETHKGGFGNYKSGTNDPITPIYA